MNTHTILGVHIAPVTFKEAKNACSQMIAGDTASVVFTPNPEMLVYGTQNPAFRKVLNAADMNVPDGAGLLWVSKKIHTTPLRERVTGTDLFDAILRTTNASVFLLGAAPGVAERVKEKYEKLNDKLDIVGISSARATEENDQELVDTINASEAQILFVAFGAPKQEQWIIRNKKKLPHVRLIMGVGGAFDFAAGKAKRAPKWMRTAGLEWLYRLIRQPKRIKRILNAVIVFPYYVLRNK